MSTLVAATRPTRRDAWQHPLQSLAAILLVALPVAFFTVTMLLGSSSNAALNLSSVRTTATYTGGVCEQSVNGYTANCSGESFPAAGQSQQELISDALPEGFTAAFQVEHSLEVTHGESTSWLNVRQIGTESDNAPAAGEILLPGEQLELLSAEVGDTITLQLPDTTTEVRIAGITPAYAAVVAEPTLRQPAETSWSNLGLEQWGITGPRKFTWDDVEQLNAVGFVVRSQDVIDDPPAPGVALEDQSSMHQDDSLAQVIGIILYLIALAVIAFLVLAIISPVFTISVGRQSRNFALMASQGAAPRHIRWAVLVYGAFAGMVGSTLGLLVGAAGFAVWWLTRYPEWPIVPDWWLLLALWAFAVLAATVAAVLPAVIASRASIIAGVHGASPDRIMRWRPWMLSGPVLLLITLVLLVTAQFLPRPVAPGSYLGIRELLVGLSALSGVPGVAFSAPAVVWLLGRVGGPLALRLAARDLLRQSLRSVPAVAAIAAFTAVGSLLMIDQDSHSRAFSHQAATVYQPGTVFIQGAEGTEQAVATLDRVLGPSSHSEVYGIGQDDDWWDHTTLVDSPGSPVRAECDWENPAPEACRHLVSTNSVPGPAGLLGAPVLVATPELLKVLQLPVDPAQLPDQAAVLVPEDVTTPEAEFSITIQGGEGVEVLGGPDTFVLAPVLPLEIPEWLLTPRAFAELGVPAEPVGAVLRAERNPTSAELSAINAELEGSGSMVNSPTVASGFWDDRGQLETRGILTGVIIVIVALVLMLSLGHTRRQHTLLGAIGAQPNLLRAANAAFGALITLGGAVLGLVAGHLGALLGADREWVDSTGWVLDPGTWQFVRIDWWLVLGLVLIAPMVAAAIGWFLSPRTQLSEYRAA